MAEVTEWYTLSSLSLIDNIQITLLKRYSYVVSKTLIEEYLLEKREDIEKYGFDTSEREQATNYFMNILVCMDMPMYGSSDEYKNEFTELFLEKIETHPEFTAKKGKFHETILNTKVILEYLKKQDPSTYNLKCMNDSLVNIDPNLFEEAWKFIYVDGEICAENTIGGYIKKVYTFKELDAEIEKFDYSDDRACYNFSSNLFFTQENADDVDEVEAEDEIDEDVDDDIR